MTDNCIMTNIQCAERLEALEKLPETTKLTRTALRRAAALLRFDGVPAGYKMVSKFTALMPSGKAAPLRFDFSWTADDERFSTMYRRVPMYESPIGAEARVEQLEARLKDKAAHPPGRGYNGCLETAAKALRYLEQHGRLPIGGEDLYNAIHLLQIADELDRTRKAT